MDLHIWLVMLAASILISISAGAGAITTIDNGLNYGFKRSYATISGLQVGLFAQILIVSIGLGALIATSSTLYEIIKWIGVVYLIYLGVMKFLLPHEKFKSSRQTKKFNFKRSFFQAVLINLTNPKATIFLIVFIPQFLNPNKPQFIQMLIICVTLLTIDFLVMSGYSFLAQLMRKWMNSPKNLILQNRITGSLLILVALFLAQSDNIITNK